MPQDHVATEPPARFPLKRRTSPPAGDPPEGNIYDRAKLLQCNHRPGAKAIPIAHDGKASRHGKSEATRREVPRPKAASGVDLEVELLHVDRCRGAEVGLLERHAGERDARRDVDVVDDVVDVLGACAADASPP